MKTIGAYRKSIRLKGYDYSREGFYFITICTHYKEHILATICGKTSQLTPFGRIVQSCWENLSKHFPSVRQDAFVVMPNHIHGIINLLPTEDASLSTVIQNFKSISTRRINNLRKTSGQPVWQQNYYERIVRTPKELNLIRVYISLNPLLWEKGIDLADADLSEDRLDEILARFNPPKP